MRAFQKYSAVRAFQKYSGRYVTILDAEPREWLRIREDHSSLEMKGARANWLQPIDGDPEAEEVAAFLAACRLLPNS